MLGSSAIALKQFKSSVVNNFISEVKMPHKLINLTLPNVIKDVLDRYPEHPYQVVFSTDEFQEKLIAQILTQAPDLNEAPEESASFGSSYSKSSRSHRSPLAERLYLEVVVRGSILQVLRENADRLSDDFSLTKNEANSLKPLFG
jgi:hypothetical protein